jgi:hypothetical protein
MPQLKTSASEQDRRERQVRTYVRGYAVLAALLNAFLLLLVMNRFHHATTPINYGLARVLLTAVAVNLATAAAILWLVLGRGWRQWVIPMARFDALTALLPFVMVALRHGDKENVFRAFGLIYVIFLLLKMAGLLMFAARNADDACSLARLPVIVFAAVFIVYGGVVPWMALASAPQGDETHFMILTHSLVFDHDFEVGNNYKNGDYKEEFPTPSPGSMRGYPYAYMQRDGIDYLPHEPHVVKNFRGQLMLQHDPGYPALLVPGYALDKREGALFTQALIGAVGAVAIFELVLILGASVFCALVTVVLFCFTCPYWVFTQAAISDLPGGVAIIWVALQFFRYRVRERNRYLLLAGVLIAIMPWLNIRWWSLAGPAFLVLSAWVIHREWAHWPRLMAKVAYLGVPSIVGLAAFAAFDKALFDTYKPNASMLMLDRVMPQFELHPIHGLMGMLFDQSYGLIPTAPLYVAVVAGLVVLFRRDRWGFAMLSLPVLGYLPFIIFSHYWFAGWNAPARYLVSATTLMIPAAALVLNRKARWVVIVLAAWSFTISIMFTVNPYLRMPSVFNLYNISMLVEYFHDHIRTPMYSILSIFPNMMVAGKEDYVSAWMWLAVFLIGVWEWSRTAKGNGSRPSPVKGRSS